MHLAALPASRTGASGTAGFLRARLGATLGPTAALDVDLWTAPSGAASVNQDAWLVGPQSGRVRLAVVDGVTPTARTPVVCGLDGAAWAARVVAAALEAPVPAVDALHTANTHLLGLPGTDWLLPRDRPHAVAAVVDVVGGSDGPRLEIVIAGDCEVYVESHGDWPKCCSGNAVTARAEREWNLRRLPDPERHGVEGLAEAHASVLGHPDAWVRSPIGMLTRPVLATAAVGAGEWDRVVVATDGARLDPFRVADVGTWLSGLRDLERASRAGTFKPHDDVVVLQASFATP